MLSFNGNIVALAIIITLAMVILTVHDIWKRKL